MNLPRDRIRLRAALKSRRARALALCGVATVATLAWLPAAAQIALVGAGPQTVSASAGSIAPALPVGTAAGDVAVLVVVGRPTDTAEPAAPAGWTLRTSLFENVSSSDLRIMTFYRVLTGSDAHPTITLPASWVGSSGGMSGQVAVWRGVDAATPFDAPDATATSNPSATLLAPAFATSSADAVVVSAVATSDDNDVTIRTAAGFTARMSGTAYDTQVGDDLSVALADKLQATPGPVATLTWQQNSNGPDRWAAITFALRRQVPPPPSQPRERLSLRFEEASWTNGVRQVADDSTYNLDGTPVGDATTANATAALATDPGTCRYGVFDGVNEYVEIGDNAALDIASELTVAAWIYMRTTPSELHTIVSKDTNYEYHIDNQRRLYWWWNDAGGATRSLTAPTPIGLNEWHHVAVTYRSGEQRMYIDGVQQAASGTWTGSLATNDLPLYVGTDWNLIGRAFDGYIDEVRVIAAALTGAEVAALRTETHPCAPVRFTVTHNAFGIHCLPETVTVNVVDAVTGTPVLNYNTTVALDTQSGYGTWGLAAGAGSFSDATAADGVATYAWPLGESQATFTLSYPEGPPAVDVDVFQSSNIGVRDDDSEGDLVFSPSGFTVSATPFTNPPGAVVPFAAHQTAGASFALHLAAFGQTASDPVCGVIESYDGPKRLKFWSRYLDPVTGTRAVTIDGSAIPNGAAAVMQDVAFRQGVAAVTAKYKDVGRVRIFMTDDATVNAELPAGITGATADFVVRPFGFVLSDIAAGPVANPAAVDATGSVFAAAGAPFRMTVTVVDAESTATPNYGRESIPESVGFATQLVAPAGGSSPAIGWTAGFGPFTDGVASGTDFSWGEVGIVRAVPGVRDGAYLTAGDVTGPPSDPIGRFIPARFAVTLNSPLFTTSCSAPAGSFTYQGEPFGFTTAPVLTATAVAANGAATTNYRDAFFKLSNATLTGRSYSSAAGALDVTGLPPSSVDPVVTTSSTGVATLTFSAGSGLAFVKGAPQAPFAAQVTLAIDVVDSDGVAAVGAGPLGNPVTFGAAGGIPFTAGDEIRHGRIRLGTAVGSELLDLQVPLRAEFFAGPDAGFVVNPADTCTTNVALTFPPASYTGALTPGETCVRDAGNPGASGIGCATAAGPLVRYSEPPVGGDFRLQLAAPGAGNQGSVAIEATVPSWLRFDWSSAAAGDENPAGQATFGVYGGERRLIYTREIY